MKMGLTGAIALSFALAATPAMAETASFRAPVAQPFSAAEAQRYGLTPEQAALADAYSREGRLVQVLTAEEAENYRAGASQTTWIVIGAIVLVVLVAAAVD